MIKIAQLNSYDIFFYDDYAASYYMNNSLGNELNLDTLNVKVLNKTVTLHLEKLFIGTSNVIAQLAIGDKIIFTEFSSNEEKVED